jgi:hypothetical protein
MFLIVFLFSSISIIGQNFNLSELIKINNLHLDDFDTYVIKKRYSFYENKNNDFASKTSYVFMKNGVKYSYISKYYYKTKPEESISFQTGDNSIYLKVKADLKILGYKFINTETFNGATYFFYKKGNIEVSLISSYDLNSYGYKVNNYEISVSKIH